MHIAHAFKVVLASRNLFYNWFSVAIAAMYYLFIHRNATRRELFVRFRCNNNNNYILNLYSYINVISAYYNGLFKLLCNNDLIGRFWGAIDLLDKDGKLVLRTPDGCLLTLDSLDLTIFAETWIHEIHYLGFDLSDWFVLDIGAFVGDTALYYAKRGAFVAAVEPLPNNYEMLLKNLELNSALKPKVVPINVAVAGEDGFVDVKYSGEIDGGASTYTTSRFTARIKSMKLSTLIKELESMGININNFKVRVLKVDCKGCEYEIVNDNALRVFDIVKIEYSGYLVNKTYHVLKEKLESMGFRCRAWAHNDIALRIGLDRHGTLTCIKQGMLMR